MSILDDMSPVEALEEISDKLHVMSMALGTIQDANVHAINNLLSGVRVGLLEVKHALNNGEPAV